jgi:Zn-dependent metalloprotease
MAKKIAKERSSGFTTVAIHSTDSQGKTTFEKLEAERSSHEAFSMASAQPERLDPESAAKRILRQALDSPAMPGLTAPTVDDTKSEFKSLGVTTMPLTGTNIVKFRQYVKGVPVYGSLVSVELGDANETISLNSNLAKPDVKASIAKVSPQEVLKTVAARAGYGREIPRACPILNYYLDPKGKWHLAYIVEDVRSRKPTKGTDGARGRSGVVAPLVYDYVVDAITGRLIAELPRTPTVTAATAARTAVAALAAAIENGIDELGAQRQFGVEVKGSRKRMRDPSLNIETYDFNFGDPEVQGNRLPGTIFVPPWSRAAVSAHVNAAVVATFLRQVLKRNNIDDQGGRIVSSVNCVVRRDSPGQRIWLNAFWDGSQMVYGQAKFNQSLRSLAAALDVVAHELFHGVTAATARLEYLNETGALNESYSDIFGIIISNAGVPDIKKWNWLIGDGISSGLSALRDFQDPTRFRQPKHMSNFVRTTEDAGGVHTNSGIHNYAAYQIMTAKRQNEAFLFQPAELAAMFYIALTQILSRQSGFADSRRGVISATRSLFRKLPQAELELRVAAVEKGFKTAGIN